MFDNFVIINIEYDCTTRRGIYPTYYRNFLVRTPTYPTDRYFKSQHKFQKLIIVIMSVQEVTIQKKKGERLGMNIKGGVGGSSGNPLDKGDEGIFISKINSSDAANRDGRLRVSFLLPL